MDLRNSTEPKYSIQ